MVFELSTWNCREHGSQDPIVKAGRWRWIYPALKEFDRTYWDPQVPRGQGAGVIGEDSRYNPDPRFMFPGVSKSELDKFIYQENFQVKDLYQKYGISPEHPGLMHWTSPAIAERRSLSNETSFFPGFGLIRDFPLRYMDDKFGENCVGKTLVVAKYSAYLSSFYTLIEWGRRNYDVRTALRRYLVHCKVPISAGAMWSAVSCLAASTREKDDWKNMAIGGVAAGCVVGSMTAKARNGVWAGAVIALLTSVWRNYLDSEDGAMFSGHSMTRDTALGNPLAWKWQSAWGWSKYSHDVPDWRVPESSR